MLGQQSILLLQRWFIFKDGVHALDGADTDLGILGHVGGFEALHGIEFGELAVVIHWGCR